MNRRSRHTRPLARLVALATGNVMALGAVVSVVGGALAVIAAISVGGLPFQPHYTFRLTVPADTPPLKVSDQVRIAGKLAGAVSDIEVRPEGLRVTAKLDTDFGPVGRDARAHVGVILGTSLAYLVVSPGNVDAPLPDGGLLPPGRVTLSSSLPQALEAFDTQTRAALGRTLDVTGHAILGRGAATNAALADLAAAARDGLPLLQALVPRPGVVRRAIRDAGTVAAAARGRRADDLGAGMASGRRVAGTLARRRALLRATAERLPAAQEELRRTLPPADATLDRTAALLRAALPGVEAVDALLPDLARTFGAGAALRREVARFLRLGQPVLARLRPVLVTLRTPAAAVAPIVTSLARTGRATLPFRNELLGAAKDLTTATSYTFDGQPAARLSGSLLCATARNPYPAPGRVGEDRRAC